MIASGSSGPPGGKADWATAPILDWLYREGRFLADPNDLTRELAERMVAEGAPLMRLRLAMRTLHPLLAGWSAVWEAGGRLERDRVATHGLERKSSYVGSPLERLVKTRTAVRRRLDGGLGPEDHTVLHELAAQGATDYLALPLPFTTGQAAAMVVVTGRSGGLSDADVAKCEAVAAAMTPILETVAAYRLAGTVASAYIGPRSGKRVLEGRIRRGDVEVVRAATWFSDLRGWSRLSNELPAAEAVALANQYFELIDGVIAEAGGEVLKLIGDAVLAIFTVEHGEAAACRAALDAARQAHARARAGGAGYRFGVGLHIGEIVYGNVGSPSRLDFTVMGRAVNLAARLEKLTGPLGHPVVVSADFARASGRPHRDLGVHPVPGWDAPVPVFAPDGGQGVEAADS